MNDNISKSAFLSVIDLPVDDSITVSDPEISDGVKTFHISREPSVYFCPHDGHRLHSKGTYKRTVSHPVMQDHSVIKLIVDQRKWKCPQCKHCFNESFPFLERYKQSTNITPLLVLDAMKDLNRSAVSIAKQFHLSDTQVHNIFTAYVDLPRLPLSEFISVDEVFMDISDYQKYAFVIMDFITGEPIDIIQNRWSSTLEDYFLHIPLEEREKVKAVISDAYSPYLEFPKNYFPNAVSILDSFHVVKVLISLLNDYVNKLYRKYKDINLKKLQKKNHDMNLDYHSIKPSQEMVLLRDYRWVLLKNHDDIKYSYKLHYHKALGLNINTYRIEDMFFQLDPDLEKIRDLKEKYIQFNHSSFEDEEITRQQLDALIKEYEASGLAVFQQFSKFLKEHKDPIVYSFTVAEVDRKTIEDEKSYYGRLSNGLMESFNRKPKDYKRNSRGSSNFDYTRNRILWATRKNTAIRGIPKTNEQIHSYKGKPRGKYNKK